MILRAHIRALLVGVPLFTNQLSMAQLVFIPDVNLRGWFNEQVTGSVNGDGYLDTSLPGVQAIDTVVLHINWQPFDLTGLEELSNLDLLYVDMHDKQGVFPALPPAIRELSILGHPSADLPTFPATLRSLELIMMPLTELPPLPDQLEILALGLLNAASIGPFPAGLKELRLEAIWPTLTEIVSFPVGLRELHVFGTSADVNVECLPTLPDGMERFWLDVIFGSAFDCVPNIPTNPAFTFSGGPIPPLCESGVHACALTTSITSTWAPGAHLVPVPAVSEVFIEMAQGTPTPFEVVDAVGAIRYRGLTNGLRTHIPIDGWTSGSYAVLLDHGRTVRRFTKE